ncbi:conserved hypothetical protein [Leptospira interrogans serovar Manilae]|uniref:Uncharacterized protein n=1 Tax=Leptospira interrogans serovar Manilae TaxID=214675 RepID=A0AAQ1P087_LEPIR|nr:hypothetical protein LIMLP_01170 [Leptospira interrogans serovar Manilae]AKP28473.1 hypothetical protein LIMHP_01165 [Leptospira interrogans serovar Manilae]SOR61948.1 conserved hypothetical protein [Leptospira interrogans serovar Manilae]
MIRGRDQGGVNKLIERKYFLKRLIFQFIDYSRSPVSEELKQIKSSEYNKIIKILSPKTARLER